MPETPHSDGETSYGDTLTQNSITRLLSKKFRVRISYHTSECYLHKVVLCPKLRNFDSVLNVTVTFDKVKSQTESQEMLNI